MLLRGTEVAARIRMGFALIYSTKTDSNLRLGSDFREVNKRIVRNLFPIPKISTVLQELEGFTCATARQATRKK